ncbi:MAG: fasciclin domain-containing protein [Planctomycetota bacterium]
MKIHLPSMLAAIAFTIVGATSFAADIVDTAVGAGKFKTLAAALGAADLVDTLKGDGPFTVFAPTDEAFANLPAGTVETLLKPENKDALTGILTYHVVPGKVLAKQVVGLKGAKTVNGQRVDIKFDSGKVQIDGANVVTTDIVCDNGVIHVIDAVILPADKTIPELAIGAGKFKTLVAAAKAAGLVDALSGDGPLTVFAPTDDAFAKLPKGTVESLLKPENKSKLADILKYHVVSGRVYSEDALAAKAAKTLQGSSVSIGIKNGAARVNDAKLVATDVDASNGVIHIIDSVLIPPAKGANTRKMLENVVAKGSRLFNSGHHEACATAYEDAMQQMMTSTIDGRLKRHVESVMTTAGHQTCPIERSWTLRHGIDQLYAQLPADHH